MPSRKLSAVRFGHDLLDAAPQWRSEFSFAAARGPFACSLAVVAGSWASQWVVPVAARLRSRSEAAVTLQRLMRLGGAEGDFAADAAVHVLATAVSHVEACAIQCPHGHHAVFFCHRADSRSAADCPLSLPRSRPSILPLLAGLGPARGYCPRSAALSYTLSCALTISLRCARRRSAQFCA